VDLVGACRVFVRVGECGSFTVGAAAARVPQPVASRRIAALEAHFGARLFDRSTRRAVLTTFGRDMLPPARRLVQLAEALEHQAGQAKLRPLSLAVPATCPVRELALLDAAARDQDLILDFRCAGPAERAELLRSREVRAALIAVPPEGADWSVPLGVAAAAGRGTGPFRIDALRPGRTAQAPRRLWIQPEDDVPHVRDRLQLLGHRAALLPAQIMVAASLTAAASAAMRTGDLLLCSAPQAAGLGLRWRPVAGEPAGRGYRLAATDGEDTGPLRVSLGSQVGRALGQAPADPPGDA
jgi:DNA-binding transcriptional LysR family regulator